MALKTRKSRRKPARTYAQRKVIKALAESTALTLAGLDSFEKDVLTYVEATGLSQTAFGYEAADQIDFIRLLRNGRDFRMSTVRKVLRFMCGKTAADTPKDPNSTKDS